MFSSPTDRGRGRGVSLSSSHKQQQQVQQQIEEVDNNNELGLGIVEEEEETVVGVQFQLQRQCSFGQKFLLTGDHPLLGSWDPNNAIHLTWSQDHIWTTVHLDIPLGKCIQFKFLLQEADHKFVWQPGPDRILQTQNSIILREDWENPDARVIITQAANQEIQFAQQPQGYIKEGVPVLVPGLSQLREPQPLNGAADDLLVPALTDQQPLNDEPEPLIGATDEEPLPLLVPGMTPQHLNDEPDQRLNGPAMVSDMATLPELDSKADIANTSNLNQRPEIPSTHRIQESCENKHQETQVAEEKDDHQPVSSLLHNDIQWSNNVMQKFLNLLGIQ